MDYIDPKLNPPLDIEWKPKHCYIPSASSTIRRISDAVDKILKNLEGLDFKNITENFTTSIKDLSRALSGANLGKVGEQAESLLSELRETNRRVANLLKDPKIDRLLPDAAATMVAARRIVEDTEKPMSQLLSAFNEVSISIKRLATQMDSLAGDASESVAHLRRILQQLDSLISDQQPDIETAVENIRHISENLRDLTENAKKYPSQLLFGEPPPHTKTGER